ncbi:hypothetical protein GQ457_04G003130 [Hibiscus cannabinus]
MASPAKISSSSSSSIPCKMSPNLKQSELNDPTRRSFSGNPFTKPSVLTNRRAFNPSTPANSPSDFPRRHSTSRESAASLRDPDKENSRDPNPKPARVRSPALSKGTKNFMSPTISAASKINASPRKQILVERNEPVRSSVSLSDVKSLIMGGNESTPEIASQPKKVSFSDVKSLIMDDTESKPEIGLNQKKVSFSDVESIIIGVGNTEPTPEISLNQVSFTDNDSTLPKVTHDSQISHHEIEEPLKSDADFDYKESENDSDSVPETVTEGTDSVNVDPTFKISPRASISPSCPTLAALDSDPLMLPYDPQTNYLSPRPQFLHYRPNPRIELYREREGMQLDKLFASESYSDTEVSAETLTEGSQRESDDVSSEETMEGEEELRLSEPNPGLKAKRMSKQLSSPTRSYRSKFITLLLFLGFACFSVLVVNSPAFTHGIDELSNYQVPQEVTEFAKANFDRFTRNLQHWSASFLSYVSNIVFGSREVHKLGPIQYANLSRLMEDHMIERQLMFDSGSTEPIWERDAGTELLDDKHHQEIEVDEAVDEDDDEQEDGRESEAFETSELVSEQPDEVQQGSEAEFAGQMEAEHQSNVETKNQKSVISPQATEVRHEISETEPEGDLNNIAETLFPEEVKSEDPRTEDSADNSQSSEVVDFTINGHEQFLSSNNVMGFALLVLCLLAASAFIYRMRGKSSMPNASVPAEQPVSCKNSEYSPVSVGSKDAILEKVSSKNWQTEVDMADGSCPSEMMSSYVKTSSYYSNRLKETNEPCQSEMSSSERSSSSYSNKGLEQSNQYQSQEKKTRKTYRRESLATSDYSTGSPSYGSFTTYEKKPSKHGGRDDEIVTPVRRSSRIRNQVTSP